MSPASDPIRSKPCAAAQGVGEIATFPVPLRHESETTKTGETSVAATWLSRHRRRLVEVGLGHALYATFNFFCDHILYVFVVYRLGLLRGGAVMTAFSLVQCAITLIIYERLHIDWVGAGSIARLDTLPRPSWWQRAILWATRRGRFVIFLALCIFQDPFITTAYFRGGRFNGLTASDWRLFIGSVLVSNLYWTLRSGAVAAVLAGAWHWFSRS